MTRIDWESNPELGEGLDRGVLYLPKTYVAWVEDSEGVTPGEEVTAENTGFYGVYTSDPSYDPPGHPHPQAVFTSESVIGDSAIRMSSFNETATSTFRWVQLHQQFNDGPNPKISVWVNLKEAFGWWGRFGIFLGMYGSETGGTYANFIVNSTNTYDSELDVMVLRHIVHAATPPGTVWEELYDISVNEWCKLTIETFGTEAVFTVSNVEEEVLASTTHAIDEQFGSVQIMADIEAVSYDVYDRMDIVVDGIESNLSIQSTDDPPDYGYGVNYVDGVPWNGLVSVEEKDTATLNTALYFDGRRQKVAESLGNFEAALSAMTYPDQLEDRFGKLMGLSYRTHAGEDTHIHMVYNAKLLPFARRSTTRSRANTVEPFTWNLVTKPFEAVPGGPPVAHMVVDVSNTPYPDAVVWLEELLYGSEWNEPRLPSPAEVAYIFEAFVVLMVTHNGDGTFTVSGPDDWVVDQGDGLYEISSPSLIQLNEDLYQISSY